MIVHRHAEKALVAMTQKMPVPASVVLAQLRAMPALPPGRSRAMVMPLGRRLGEWSGDRNDRQSNGDTVVIIQRDEIAITAMLRRSWDQQFTPEVLRVDEVIEWDQKEKAA